MKTLYIECKMGAAGDMIMSSLFELLDEASQKEFLEKINTVFGHDVKVVPEYTSKCGISGTHMHVSVLGTEEAHHHNHEHHHHNDHEHHHHHEHHHYSYQGIAEKISVLPLDPKVISDALAIYKTIGEAEAKVHNSTLDNIHFHEVGSMDAMCDVVGCSLLMNMIGPDKVIVSPVHVGNGTVKCAHGILPVPAPATAEILTGIPYYTGTIDSELCTPTGAAILKHFAKAFDSMPVMTVEKTGVGLGTKDFETANMIRTFIGGGSDCLSDSIYEISCNIDDMTGEELGFAMDVLFDNGALDVFYSSIQMKKNRPGVLLRCICKNEDLEKFQNLILRHTTTRGVRFIPYSRVKLAASFEEIATPMGPIRKKTNSGYGIEKSKYEFDDLKKIATENNISLYEAKKILPD